MNTNIFLKQTRIARDLSQDELAEIVDCDQSWIAHLETGGKRRVGRSPGGSRPRWDRRARSIRAGHRAEAKAAMSIEGVRTTA
jgi:transcriptional regulator with XRE-family HTH domain